MATIDVAPSETPKRVKKRKKKKGQGIESPDTYVQQEIGKFPTGELVDELFPDEYAALQELKKRLGLDKPAATILNDRLLIAMLFARKFDMNRAEKMANGFLEWATTDDRYKRATDPESLCKEIILSGVFLTIPGARSREGFTVIYNRVALSNPEKFDREDMVDVGASVHTLTFIAEGMDYHRNGACVVVDMKGMSWAHFDVEMRKKFMELLQNKFPCRPKRILVLHPPVFFTALTTILRLFVRSKILNRMRVLNGIEDLHKYIDKSQLPDFYGGDITYSPEDLLNHLIESRKRLIKRRKKSGKKTSKDKQKKSKE